MRTCDLAGADVGIAGLGQEGQSVRAALARAGHRGRLVVMDDRTPPAGETAWLSGEAALAALPSLDVVVASPGVPPDHPFLVTARTHGLAVTTATNLFLAEMRELGREVVAITGSKGKSTTSTLLHRALLEGGQDSVLAGNIGVPALDLVDELARRDAVVVLETSSYQAHHVDRGPGVVVLLELFPEHVPWHGSLEAYYDAKLRLARTQGPADTTIWNARNPDLALRAPFGPARHVAFASRDGFDHADGWFLHRGERLFDDAAMLLRGAHNRRNACAVLAAGDAIGVGPDAVARALAAFGGLPHRLEVLPPAGGLAWVNDAISTAPEAAVAALEAFSGEARALIAGGHDRGYDFTPLARAIVQFGVTHVALLPDTGPRLGEALAAGGARGVNVFTCTDLDEAVRVTAREAPQGSTVLFSPASPSYGAFRNFQERGETFRRLVAALRRGGERGE